MENLNRRDAIKLAAAAVGLAPIAPALAVDPGCAGGSWTVTIKRGLIPGVDEKVYHFADPKFICRSIVLEYDTWYITSLRVEEPST